MYNVVIHAHKKPEFCSNRSFISVLIDSCISRYPPICLPKIVRKSSIYTEHIFENQQA